MAKKAPVTQVTDEMIDKASRTSTARDLVTLAEAFARAGAHGPYTVELPLFCACAVKEKGYRQHAVPSGTRVNAGSIRLGKRNGLIFLLPIEGEWVCDKGPVEWIELSWDDVINTFADLADRVEGYMGDTKVADIDAAVIAAIERNKAMHKILSEGFVLAQKHKRENVGVDELQANPLFGLF